MTTCHVGQPTRSGALSLFPVWTDQPVPARDYVAYPQSDAVRFGEAPMASVARLSADNSGPLPVLVLEGQTVVGGLQDRVLNTTVLLARGKGRPIPVSCVERGRWGQRRGRAPRPGFVPTNLRAAKVRAVADHRAAGSWASDQGRVWAEVDRYQARFATRSATSNFHEVRDRVVHEARTRRDELPDHPLPGQRGLVVGIAGRARLLELFDHEETLAAYWSALLESAVTEAHGLRALPTLSRDAHRFVERVTRARWTATPSVDLGDDLRPTSHDVTGAALRWNDRLVHLTAFAEVAA